MGLSAVPEEKHMAAEVASEVTQKGPDLLLLDVLEMKLEIEVETLALGTHRDGGNG
jgi:hypothetical protein